VPNVINFSTATAINFSTADGDWLTRTAERLGWRPG
jgi:hypothetical protein